MSITSLLPVGGAALSFLAAKALGNLSDGLSFKALLAGNQVSDSGKDDNAPAATEVSLDLTQALPQFVSRLRERLDAAGVDLTQPLTLKEDGRGGAIVDGDHADWSTIEQVLAQDSQLMADFEAIAAAASERRQSQPLAIDNAFGEFRLQLAGETATIRFE